jgi:hypothetical protein
MKGFIITSQSINYMLNYLTYSIIDQKMSLHDTQFCKLETTLIGIISRELISKPLSPILSCEAKSWWPHIWKWSRNTTSCVTMVGSAGQRGVSTENRRARHCHWDYVAGIQYIYIRACLIRAENKKALTYAV